MIFFTTNFIPDNAAGCTRGPLIFIRPEYKNDKGLIEHEKIHRWQWFRTFGLHSFLYLLSDVYRLAAEVEAYREQAKYYNNDRRELFAEFISRDYGISVSVSNALKLLVE